MTPEQIVGVQARSTRLHG
ncbi:MAG: hypothetical protein QMC69_03900, partial [Gammaproteobacteria bacterium]